MVTPVIDENFSDLFGRQITLNVKNEANLASHYDYSPERYRVTVDGARQFIQYDGEPSQFEDTTDSFKLKPQAEDEVVTFESTEIYRYFVQYVTEWSVALQTNQALQTGDVVTAGYGDADLENSSDDTPGPSADGWFFIWDSGLSANQVRLAQYRNGTEQDASVRTVEQAITDWTRRAAEVAWYSVMQSRFIESYTRDGEGINNTIGSTSIDDEKGPLVGNHSIQISVKAGASGAGSLEVEVGSMGLRNFGDIDSIVRRKTAPVTTTGTAIGSTNTYVPIHAIRIDPDRQIVHVDLTDIDIAEFTGTGDIVVVAFSFDQDKLRDSGGNAIVDGDFSVPDAHSDLGSVIQETSAVAQFPNSAGTIVTSADNPGGYQEGFGSLYTSGGGSKAPTTQAGQQARRTLSERDIVVFLAKATDTGDVKMEYTTEQEW